MRLRLPLLVYGHYPEAERWRVALAGLLLVGGVPGLPAVRTASAAFIETWRGLPLLGVLFVSAVMVPLFLPNGVSAGRVLRAVVALSLFYGAYMAEVVRGGLQGVAGGQDEAGHCLGLRPLQATWLVTLPQALRQSIPGLVNTVIDLLGTMSQALRDPAWPGLAAEGSPSSASSSSPAASPCRSAAAWWSGSCGGGSLARSGARQGQSCPPTNDAAAGRRQCVR